MNPLPLLVFIFLCIFQGALADQETRDFLCEDNLENSPFNHCLIEIPTSGGTIWSRTLTEYVEPEFLLKLCAVLLVIIPIVILENRNRRGLTSFPLHSVQRFHFVRVNILNLLHRIGYVLVLNTGLLAIFRQPPPCKCPEVGVGLVRVGPFYGMPNTSGMLAGLLGAFLIDDGPYFPILSRLVGPIVMLALGTKDIITGFSSFGQAIVGWSFGILLHLYSTRAPQYMIVVDFFVEFVAGIVSLALDNSLEFEEGDECKMKEKEGIIDQHLLVIFSRVNLYARFIYGLGFEVFTVLMILRHFHQIGPWENLKSSISKINSKIYTRYERADKNDTEYFDPMEEDLIQLRQPFKTVSDIVFTLCASICILLGIVLSVGTIEKAWFQ